MAFVSLDNLPPQPNGMCMPIFKRAPGPLYLPKNVGSRSFQPLSMAVDAAVDTADDMVALLEELNPPYHRAFYYYCWYIKLPKSVSIPIDHYIC